MSERGTYGALRVGTDPYGDRGSSLGAWLLGGLLVGGGLLWAKHQSDQIDKLYAAVGLPHESFIQRMRARTRELSGAAGEKIKRLTHRVNAGKVG